MRCFNFETLQSVWNHLFEISPLQCNLMHTKILFKAYFFQKTRIEIECQLQKVFFWMVVTPKQCIKFSTRRNRVALKGFASHDIQRHRMLCTFRQFSAFNRYSLFSLSMNAAVAYAVSERGVGMPLNRRESLWENALTQHSRKTKRNRPFCYSHLSSAALSNILYVIECAVKKILPFVNSIVCWKNKIECEFVLN